MPEIEALGVITLLALFFICVFNGISAYTNNKNYTKNLEDKYKKTTEERDLLANIVIDNVNRVFIETEGDITKVPPNRFHDYEEKIFIMLKMGKSIEQLKESVLTNNELSINSQLH